MIETHPSLTWTLASVSFGPHGEQLQIYDCREHPRLHEMRQRPGEDVEWRATFVVDGIAAQHYADPVDAIEAMRANPCS